MRHKNLSRPKIPPRLVRNAAGQYLIRYWCNLTGRYKDVSTGTSSESDAQMLMNKGDFAQVALLGQVTRITRHMIETLTGDKAVSFEQATDAYLRHVSDRGRSESTVERYKLIFLGWRLPPGKPVELLAETDCDEYINRQDGAHARTREMRRKILGSLFAFCNNHGWMTRNPAKLVDVRHGLLSQKQLLPAERVPFTKEEIALLLANAKGFWNLAVRLSQATGMRLGDICTLDWASVGTEGPVKWMTMKTAALVEAAPPPELLAEIRALYPTGSNYCFPKYAHRYLCVPMRTEIIREFRVLCRKLKIEGKSFHCLRHGFAQDHKNEQKRELLDRLIEELALDRTKLAMGHSSSETTKGYLGNGRDHP